MASVEQTLPLDWSRVQLSFRDEEECDDLMLNECSEAFRIELARALAQRVPIQATGGPILSCSDDDEECDGDVAEFEPYELEHYDDEETMDEDDE